ncbi:protein mono-ADP-ribosyltransferase PARP4-like [Helianthus annuus]|uniref:protein mono-ADP-ribosyltransferase PARP4-like n=1 Tax=Helianthus annuus TaxID=4232 RepID=UPI000B8F2DC1|nr:protein mono-ADP-ribosyltransferase PARP4-like [Helianthus annuus]
MGLWSEFFPASIFTTTIHHPPPSITTTTVHHPPPPPTTTTTLYQHRPPPTPIVYVHHLPPPSTTTHHPCPPPPSLYHHQFILKFLPASIFTTTVHHPPPSITITTVHYPPRPSSTTNPHHPRPPPTTTQHPRPPPPPTTMRFGPPLLLKLSADVVHKILLNIDGKTLCSRRGVLSGQQQGPKVINVIDELTKITVPVDPAEDVPDMFQHSNIDDEGFWDVGKKDNTISYAEKLLSTRNKRDVNFRVMEPVETREDADVVIPKEVV